MAARTVLRFAGKIPKLGNSSEECEDDFCSAQSLFAVADGASEGSYSQVWAGILVRSFCTVADAANWKANDFSVWLEQCRLQWSDWERGLAEKELPWFTREKLQLGSFATFLGLSIDANTWHAVACGDSCLFVVRSDALIDAFPIPQSELFDNTPALLSTANPFCVDQLQIRDGEILPGDRLYLTSDALASWFLADCEKGEKPWIALEGIRADEDFEIFVSEERQRHAMRNDDVTLISLDVTD